MSAPTPRGADVVRRARQLGLSAEYVGPGVKINGKTRTVAEADAYVWATSLGPLGRTAPGIETRARRWRRSRGLSA